MAHFEHLRLRKHKGLQEIFLKNLGRINVICGPNNSGKTTVLECIIEKKHYSYGRVLNGESIQRINVGSMTGRNWTSPSYKNLYEAALAKIFGESDIYFVDDLNSLWQKISKDYQEKRGGSLSMGTEFGNAYLAEFHPQPSTVLIPAKRRLETSKQVNAFDLIRPDGEGVLNFLFNAKNQDESSQKWKQFDAISAAFHEISSGFEFDVFIWEKDPNVSPPRTNVELKFRKKGGSWIQAADCGLGLQELLIILYFALASEHEVVLVEEPENHVHPEIQRRLIAFLREKTEKQFFLSTHSSVFLNTQFADRVFTCRMTDSVHVENATSRAALLTELGYSIADNLVSDLVVLCEGPKDKPVLEEFFQKMGLLDRSNIKVWPLGGDIMDQLDLSVFQQSHQLIALIDNDPGSSPVRKRFLKKCEELKIAVTRLQRYSLENYFSLPAIASVMKGQMPDLIELDPSKRVSDQLGFEVKTNGGKIAKEMKLEDIKGTDFEAFLKQIETITAQINSK
jgi:ABC-type cobalamin/Fe3+-siderophores transport system ATPase subunit